MMTRSIPRHWNTLGEKQLPSGVRLRIQLDAATRTRRVQHRVLPGWWLTLPEPLAMREALAWNSHIRLAVDAAGCVVHQSVFMVLRPGTTFLPLTDPRAERHTASLYATVSEHGWYDEDRRCWRTIDAFFVTERI